VRVRGSKNQRGRYRGEAQSGTNSGEKDRNSWEDYREKGKKRLTKSKGRGGLEKKRKGN